MLALGGAVAIYDIESTAPNDNPFLDPLNNVSRLHFHSVLRTLCVVKINGQYAHTGSFTAPAQGRNTFENKVHTVIASHGLGSTPIVFGKITVSGVTSPFLGTVPLYFMSNDVASMGQQGFGHWAHLGADSTSVFIRTFSVNGDSGASLPAFTASYEVYVTNTLLDGTTTIYPGDSVVMRMSSSLFTAGYGQLDSRNRYIKTENSSPTTKFALGKTNEIVPNFSTSKNSPVVRMRHSVDGYVNYFGFGGAGGPTGFSTFNASVQGVKF